MIDRHMLYLTDNHSDEPVIHITLVIGIKHQVLLIRIHLGMIHCMIIVNGLRSARILIFLRRPDAANNRDVAVLNGMS